MSASEKSNQINLGDEFNQDDPCKELAKELAIDAASPMGQALENILKRRIADTEESSEEIAFHGERRRKRAAIPYLPASRLPN